MSIHQENPGLALRAIEGLKHENPGLAFRSGNGIRQETSGPAHRAGNGIKQDKETHMINYNDIVCIEAELSGYRRGCLRVSIDLEKKLVTWKDSLQWNNNFLRSISPDKAKQFQLMIPATRLLQWKTHYTGLVTQDDIASCHPADWTVVISFSQNPPVRIIGSRQFPQEWRVFRDLVESITKIPFRLR